MGQFKMYVTCIWYFSPNSTLWHVVNLLHHFSCVDRLLMAPWCSGYHCCTTSFNETWTQVLRKFKSCLRRVGDLRWWGSLTTVPAGNKVKRLSSVNHSLKTIHHHYHDSLAFTKKLLNESIYGCFSISRYIKRGKKSHHHIRHNWISIHMYF